jgi:hypothetical protein
MDDTLMTVARIRAWRLRYQQSFSQGGEMEAPVNKNESRDALVDLVWHDLQERVSKAKVSQTVLEISEKFHDATITAFIPIIVRRLTRERLRKELRLS